MRSIWVALSALALAKVTAVPIPARPHRETEFAAATLETPTCIDGEAHALEAAAENLGLGNITTCADVLNAGYCTHPFAHEACCATCTGFPVDESSRSARKNIGCLTNSNCPTSACPPFTIPPCTTCCNTCSTPRTPAVASYHFAVPDFGEPANPMCNRGRSNFWYVQEESQRECCHQQLIYCRNNCFAHAQCTNDCMAKRGCEGRQQSYIMRGHCSADDGEIHGLDGVVAFGTCGGGNVGNGICPNAAQCCSTSGHCALDDAHCNGCCAPRFG